MPWASLIAHLAKNLSAMQETWVQSLGWEDPLEKETTTDTSILSWRIPWTEKPGRLQYMGSHGQNSVIKPPRGALPSLPLLVSPSTATYPGVLLISSVQSLSRVRLFATPWTASHQASLSITNSWSLPKLMSIESVMPSNHLILCCPLLLLFSIFPTSLSFQTIQFFASGGQSIGVLASASALPMNIQD